VGSFEEFTHSALERKLDEILLRIQVEEMDRPHIVLAKDRSNGHVTYSGPYSNAVQAMQAAEVERAAFGSRADEGLSFHVAALYPALEVDA
jgi:hypothetical protein